MKKFLVGLLLIAAAQSALAQAPVDYAPTLTFDVASIRENKAEHYQTGSENPDHASRYVAKNLSVSFLIQWAFLIRPDQLSRGPEWMQSSTWYIEAKGDQAAEDKLAKLTGPQADLEKRHMMQQLLADRFHLRFHWEDRTAPAYALVVTKGGSKLHPGGSIPLTPLEQKIFGTGKVPPLRQNWEAHGMEFFAHSVPLDDFAMVLSHQMGQQVINRTDLTGLYDFTLQYWKALPDDRTDPTLWPPLIEALPSQLGLRIEPIKGPVKTLVIDNLDHPSEN